MSLPIDEYPNPDMTRQPQSDSSHSTGSFGPVFAVLAFIVVISAVACVLGRLCSKKGHRVKEAAHRPTKAGKQSKELGPKEWESRQKPSFSDKDGDIGFGFGKGAPKQGGKQKAPHQNGGKKPEVRF